MESSMAQWYQASSSEYSSISPSQSPPRSPTLYYYNANFAKDEDGIKTETTGTGALNASTLLRQLEEFGYQQFNDDSSSSSSLGWTGVGDEMSVNLELFEGLCEPLTSPAPAQEDFKIEQQLLLFEDPTLMPVELATNNDEFLSTEFQSIIDSLPVTHYGLNEELDESETVFSVEAPDTPAEGDEEDEFESYMEVEVEEQSLGANEDHLSEKILDALLEGNLLKAESYIPKTIIATSAIKIVDEVRPSSSSSRQQPQKKKMSKPRLSSKTDKVSRKKEQNKTAATRYREKKKLQANIINHQEEELGAINDKLQSKREDLRREILLVKQLLREVVLAKKMKRIKK